MARAPRGSRRQHAAGCWRSRREFSGGPVGIETQRPPKATPPMKKNSDRDYPARRCPPDAGAVRRDRAFTRGVRAGVQRSPRVKSACTRPIRSASLASSAGVIIALSLASVTQRLSSLSKIDRRRGSVVACAARSQSAAFSHGSIAAPIAPGDFICSVNNGNGTRFHLALLVFLEGLSPKAIRLSS